MSEMRNNHSKDFAYVKLYSPPENIGINFDVLHLLLIKVHSALCTWFVIFFLILVYISCDLGNFLYCRKIILQFVNTTMQLIYKKVAKAFIESDRKKCILPYNHTNKTINLLSKAWRNKKCEYS